MIGAVIGDVVGSRFEFNNHRSTRFKLFTKESRFTDDTVCTAAVCDWLVRNGGIKSGGLSFASVLQDWCKRYPMGDYGMMFHSWINFARPYGSFGNGAAMRISPLSFFANNSHDLEVGVEMVTSVSHDHPEGIKGAMAIATAGYLARFGGSKYDIKAAVSRRFGYNLDQSCDQIRRVNTFDETCQVSVPQALVCFLESTDFESAIRLAVSIGGDSDTIACMVGGIAEAYYGYPGHSACEVVDLITPDILAALVKFYAMFVRNKSRHAPLSFSSEFAGCSQTKVQKK